MEEFLKVESEKLAGCWMRHESGWLQDYLVQGVEDPRLNLQSVFSRHFLIRALFGERFNLLMAEEYRFAAVMNWLVGLAGRSFHSDELESVLHALRRKADNAEGIEIPYFVPETFSMLTSTERELKIPNYIEDFLRGTRLSKGQPQAHQPSLDTFQNLWRHSLSQFSTLKPKLISVLEPACGSANDYRMLDSFGVAPLIDYAGFDLCATNVENARALFPDIRFQLGNVFEVPMPDKSFDFCFVHDLFEHLSLQALPIAVEEVCRVTKEGVCAGFFQMDEISEHIERPVNDYYLNLLSMAQMQRMFARHGFDAQVVHVGTFLRERIGCDQTHNPTAYTFIAARFPASPCNT